MNKQSVLKVKGGKMIRINLSYDESITYIKITGDFFLYPEEDIEKLELQLIGATKKDVYSILDKFFRKSELIGAVTEDFYKAIISAIN